MKVALVYPNMERCANQGVGHIACAATQAGHNVDLFDTAYISLGQASSRVTAGNYDVVLISASTLFYRQATLLAAQIKAVSDVPILLGGLHATALKGNLLRECPDFDYLCVGEGEEFIVEFLEQLETGDVASICNLGYRDNGKIVVNPVRPCTDLNSLPPFDHRLFPPDSIIQAGPKPGFCYVYATRGCPYRCSYCCNGCYLELYGKSYLRKRSIDTVITELQWLKANYPVRFFYFGDEMILFDLGYCRELFTRLHQEVNLPYGCMARVERITPDVVDLLRETGCKYTAMGVECGDEEFRRAWLNRRMSNEQIISAFRLLRSIPSITLTAFCMTGWPVSYDDRLTKSTKKLIKELKPDIAQPNIFYPFPGTKLYDYCVQHQLIDWEKARSVTNILTTSVLKPIQ